MEPYLYKWTLETILLDHYLGKCNKYTFMLDIFRQSPDLAEGYLQHFKDELEANDKRKRCSAVVMFGKMFSMGPINLAVREPEIWNLFLERFHDRWVRVKKECLKKCADIALRWPQLFGDLIIRIADMQGDKSLSIRIQTVKTLEKVAIGNFDVVEFNDLYWEILNIRAHDVQFAVRKEVKSTLTAIHNFHEKIMTLHTRGLLSWIIGEISIPQQC